MKTMKRILAAVLTAAIAVTPVSALANGLPSPTAVPHPVRQYDTTPYYVKTVGKQIAVVDTWDNGNCSIKRVNPNATTVSYTGITVKNGAIAGTDTKSAVGYKVTRIKRGAFAKAAKVKSVTLGPTFRLIDYKAFTGAKSLRKIIIQATSIGRVDPGAFQGVDVKKIVVYVPSRTTAKQLAAFKEKFKALGFLYRNIRRSGLF